MTVTQISRARYYSTLNISETVQDTNIYLQWNTDSYYHYSHRLE